MARGRIHFDSPADLVGFISGCAYGIFTLFLKVNPLLCLGPAIAIIVAAPYLLKWRCPGLRYWSLHDEIQAEYGDKKSRENPDRANTNAMPGEEEFD